MRKKERKKERVCIWVYVRKTVRQRERVSVCVYFCVRERKKERKKECMHVRCQNERIYVFVCVM